MYVCMHNHVSVGGGGGWGHAPLGNFKITCSEIASGAILGQKQSRSIAQSKMSIICHTFPCVFRKMT